MKQNIPETVTCYIKKDDCYLLLYRNKEENDMNEGKWLGVGGHVEKNETIDHAMIREIKEETGLDVYAFRCAGEVLFINDDYQEKMYVYEVSEVKGELIACNEGDLSWIPVKDIYQYPMWEGDKVFLPLLFTNAPYFKFTLIYKNKDLVEVIKNN